MRAALLGDEQSGHLRDANEPDLVLPGTLKDVAAALGLTHEALYRTLSQREAEGEIACREGKVKIAGPTYD